MKGRATWRGPRAPKGDGHGMQGAAPAAFVEGGEEGEGGVMEKKETNWYVCNEWQRWVISPELHVEVQNGMFWSCGRGSPTLQAYLHYSSRVGVAPWSFGAGVFG
jgi:hypothetical protein